MKNLQMNRDQACITNLVTYSSDKHSKDNMSQNFLCFLTLLLIQTTLADIYDNCGGNGENCLIQNKGNKPDPDSGSGDCLAEKVSLLVNIHI